MTLIVLPYILQYPANVIKLIIGPDEQIQHDRLELAASRIAYRHTDFFTGFGWEQ